MKFFKKRSVAWVVLVLAVAAGVWIGFARKDHFLAKQPTELLEVQYRQWICDDAKLLSNGTKQLIEQYNADWDERYYAVVAVATVEHLTGWEGQEYAANLGQQWGLGENDMILLLVEDSDWQVYCGDRVSACMTDTQQQKLRSAIDSPYYTGDFNAAVTAFFRQSDVFYGQAQLNSGGSYSSGDPGWYAQEPAAVKTGGVSIGGVVLLIVAIFAVWVLLDRMRYNRYRRRYVMPGIVPPVAYYPIFWGRRLAAPRAPRPPRRRTITRRAQGLSRCSSVCSQRSYCCGRSSTSTPPQARSRMPPAAVFSACPISWTYTSTTPQATHSASLRT